MDSVCEIWYLLLKPRPPFPVPILQAPHMLSEINPIPGHRCRQDPGAAGQQVR